MSSGERWHEQRAVVQGFMMLSLLNRILVM